MDETALDEIRKLKILLGKILGEVRMISAADEDSGGDVGPQVVGLVKGIEAAVDEELHTDEWISWDEIRQVGNVLEPYEQDPATLQGLTGYYDIDSDLMSLGRAKAGTVIAWLKSQGKYPKAIKAIEDGGNSPIECKTFDLTEGL